MFDLLKIWEGLMYILISMSGGLVKLLQSKDVRRLKLYQVLIELFIAGFCGFMTWQVIQAMGVDGAWTGVICGVAGLTSPMILYEIIRVGERLLGFEDGGLTKKGR